MAVIACRMTDIQADTVPELFNGAVGAATIPIRAIPNQYHWINIANMPRADAAFHMKAYVRAYYGAFGEAEVARRNAAAGAGASLATDPGADNTFIPSRAHVTAIPMLRKRAICIGAARAGMLKMWNVGALNLIGTETSAAEILTYNAGNITTIHALANANLTLAESIAANMVEFDRDEEDIMYAIFQLSMAAVPLAGLSILNTGHHYLTGNTTATDRVMKQVMTTSSDAVKTWFAADALEVKDMIWHKSAHPLDSAYIILQALSPTVAERLRSASLGSAAVRLPYVEPEVKAAQAMIAVVNMVQQTVTDARGVLAIPSVATAVTIVKTFQIRAPDVAAGTVAGHPTVVNRTMAINDILTPAVNAAAVAVAYALGICSAMLENAARRDRQSTLMTAKAKSLARIRTEHMSTVALGAAFYENMMRKERTDAGKGKITGPNLTF